MLPTKSKIEKHARELWHSERARQNDPSFEIEPELEELEEEGFLSAARSQLMRHSYRSQLESELIDFAEKFTIDLKELYESNALILGSRHTGKSDIGMKIAEKAMKDKAIVVCFDPSLDWLARSSITQYIKVKCYTNLDVPSESTIFDISLLSPLEQQRTVERFSEQLFESQARAIERKQYLIIFEEAHTYFFQGSMRAKAMQNTVRLLSVGRNVDIASVLISQFASMLSKFCVKHSTSQAWFGFTKEPNDLRYLKLILGDNAEELKKLEDGQFLFMNRSGLGKISIEPFKSQIVKEEITLEPTPILEPKITKSTQVNASLSSVLITALWFVAILLVLSQTW